MSKSNIEKAFKEGVIAGLFYIGIPENDPYSVVAISDDEWTEQIADTLWEQDGEAILILLRYSDL